MNQISEAHFAAAWNTGLVLGILAVQTETIQGRAEQRASVGPQEDWTTPSAP